MGNNQNDSPDNSSVSLDRAFNSEKVVKSILSLVGGTIFARVIAFFGTTYLARVLGPDGFGIFGFSLALSGYLSLIMTAGVNVIGTREVARRPENAANLAASVILFRLGLAVVAFLLNGIVAWFLPKPMVVKLVLALTGLSYFTLALDTSWVHKGLEQNRRVGLSIVFIEVVNLGLLLVLVTKPNDVIFVPVASFGGQLVAALFLAGFVFNHLGIKANFREGFQLFNRSRFLVLSKLSRTLIFSFDVILLGFLSTEYQVGLYTAAYRICYMLIAISAAINFSYLPSFARTVAEGLEKITELTGRSLELSWCLIAPFIFGGMILARPLLVVLFGKNYADADLALQLLLISTGCIFLRVTLENIWRAYDLLRTEMGIMLIATALNIGLDFLLIPHYEIFGAALATALADGLILLLGLLTMYKLGIKPDWKPLLKILLAGGVMVVALLIGKNHIHIVYEIVLGGIIYLLALAIFGAIPRDLLSYLNKFTRQIRKSRVD